MSGAYNSRMYISILGILVLSYAVNTLNILFSSEYIQCTLLIIVRGNLLATGSIKTHNNMTFLRIKIVIYSFLYPQCLVYN